MHEPKAKAVIMLFMEGGPSQTDTFDPKPKLNSLHLTESTRTAGLATGKRFFVGSPFKSRKVGNAGIEMSEPWQYLADPAVADDDLTPASVEHDRDVLGSTFCDVERIGHAGRERVAIHDGCECVGRRQSLHF